MAAPIKAPSADTDLQLPERAVIYAAMNDSSGTIADKLAWVQSDWFSHPDRGTAWQAIQRLRSQQKSLDVASVATVLHTINSVLSVIDAEGILNSILDDPYTMSAYHLADQHAHALAKRAQAHDRERATIFEFPRRWAMGDLQEAIAWYQDRMAAIDAYVPSQGVKHDPDIFTLRDLLSEEIAPINWIVEDVIPEGFTFLVGKPKMGKSWLVLSLCVAIAAGGKALGRIDVEQGSVLYLSLEDNKRRLRKRTDTIIDRTLRDNPGALGRFHLATKWPTLDKGGAAKIESWIKSNPDARLIVVDTLAKIRGKSKPNGNIYQEDTETVSQLKDLSDRYNVAMIVVHHFNKLTGGDDWFDQVSGSTGLVGAADNTLGLMRERGKSDAVLRGCGRDILDLDYAMTFDQQLCQWSIAGDASEYAASKERNTVLALLQDRAPEPLHYDEVARLLNEKSSTIRSKLSRMVDAGEIKSVGHGCYTIINNRDKSATSATTQQVQQVQQMQQDVFVAEDEQQVQQTEYWQTQVRDPFVAPVAESATRLQQNEDRQSQPLDPFVALVAPVALFSNNTATNVSLADVAHVAPRGRCTGYRCEQPGTLHIDSYYYCSKHAPREA